jgi:mitochondrial intermediate peptidase
MMAWEKLLGELGDIKTPLRRRILPLCTTTHDMLKSVVAKRWICPQCSHVQFRKASTLVAAASTDYSKSAPITPATFSNNDAQDDKILRKVFDSRKFWYQFSKTSRNASIQESGGLVRNKYLKNPDGFLVYARDTTRRCQALVDKTLAVNTVEGYKNIVRDLDRLSDLLCRVIDLSDFIRSTHPDRKYQHMATQAYSTMYEYMNQLNTTTGLNEQLKKATEIPEVWESWSPEERFVANILMKDFSKSAIHLPKDSRRDFINLSNQILDAGSIFVDHMSPQKPYIRFATLRLKGLSPTFIKSHSRFGLAAIPSTSSPAYEVLARAEDPDIRWQMYMANRNASDSTIQKLEEMLLARSKLAKLAGFESYGHMALSDKMAKTPEAVNEFLSSLHADTQPIVETELQELLDIKAADALTGNFANRINAWDKDFYVHRLMSMRQTNRRSREILSGYFSLGTVFQGLSRLFSKVYGIRFVPRESHPGETWDDEVRRLDVVDDYGKTVAVVYCDLFTRPGKTPNPAHFTLRCSRAILPSEIEEYAEDPSNPFSDPLSAATEGNAFSHDPISNTIHQLPTIALICDFHHANPTLLSLRDVQTLFHEMGHALHSILGRTQLQNVAGTRCATDLAEVPSVLMEHFALAPQVLSLWARHWETDKPLPYELVQEELRIEKSMKQGLETEDQITMARLDQALHSRLWCDEPTPLDSTAVYQTISATTSLPDPPGTRRQGFFGHLYGYGATYYSYLFARAIAAKVWRDVFGGGMRATDREAGERLKGEFLGHGGSRDGWKCVAGLLQDERLVDGGEEAMRIVGRWGVKGDNTDVHLH